VTPRLQIILGAVLLGILWSVSPPVTARSAPPEAPVLNQDLSPASPTVAVKPAARDEEIQVRLKNVLDATGWFPGSRVRVKEGVVFLDGATKSAALRAWAGDLARNTQGVVAVANRLEVREESPWNFKPAWSGLADLWRGVVRSLPMVVLGLLILLLSFGVAILVLRGARRFFHRKIQTSLLRNVIAYAMGGLVFLVGIYVVLRTAGLTQLALTVVGGTGLIGLAVGIAFRNITENFLASVFLSVQHPFETGDLVEIAGAMGYVQQLNVRSTIIMTLDGNLVQIPNAVVYKSNLTNFTTNCNRRETVDVGIGYDDSISRAQEVARQVLANHPAVLKDPEPWVLADNLGPSTIRLRIYFWLNGREHSWLKVRSSVIRLVKQAFQAEGISMPDEAREVIFPREVPVRMLGGPTETEPDGSARKPQPAESSQPVSTEAEAGLSSEADVIQQQAGKAPSLKEGNLLKADPVDTP
jgi:small-conductance mechanosensitive channel